jgi:hypothetical protein
MQNFFHLTPDELVTLGYTDLSHIVETEAFRLYRTRTHIHRTVLIKIPSSSNTPKQQIDQLEHEIEISCDLNLKKSVDRSILLLICCSYEKVSDRHTHPLGETGYRVKCTLVATHGGVATPCNSWLLRVVAPCPAAPQTHTSPCPTDLFRLNPENREFHEEMWPTTC